MFKRFILAFGLIAGLLSPSFGAGTIPLSLSQRFDNISHLPLAKGQLFFIQAGTTSTLQNAFQDSALTIPYANPLTLDAGGNIPQLFFADGQIKIRLQNAAGVVQLSADNLQVIGASSGGGGGGSVDPTTILSTGDIKANYGTGVLVGFVRLNGRTIGSASSGASERANADTQALFQYLWGVDPNLVVSTGRGASANADWVANKQLTLPDARNRALAGLGDMGNSDAARLTSTYFGVFTGANGTTLGAAGGAESETLTALQVPSITSGVSTALNINVDLLTSNPGTGFGLTSFSANAGAQVFQAFSQGASISQISAASATATGSASSNNTGGQPHPIASPMILVTFYQKL